MVGPGGGGKTRLALEVAGRAELPGGVFFVALVDVAEPAGLAEAVGLATKDREGLRGWLRDKEALLVLDNFEHLSEGAALLADLLEAAPGVKLLVTLREALHLHAEWLFHLGGLDLPETDSATDVADSAAVRLFVQSARRAQASFALTEANAPEVARVCWLVGGSPLGIELAAAWVRVQDCAAIASEIERDLDFLASPRRDVPQRHRSMRAVFEHSWALLSDSERQALRRLSVFRGGFEAEAAREVAGVDARLLAALLDRSLLGRTGPTRYELHELLRQFAEELLASDPEEHEALRARHVAYYQAFTAAFSLEPGPISPEAWARRGERELDNLRAALEPERPHDALEAGHPPPDERARALRAEAGVIIARPLEEVFAFAANPENEPRWRPYSRVVEARCTGGPVGVGTGIESTLRLIGRRLRSTAVVTEYLENARVCYHSTSGPVRYRHRRLFEAGEGGTRLTMISELDLSGALRMVRAALARVAQRAFELDLEYLKRLLEAGGAEAARTL